MNNFYKKKFKIFFFIFFLLAFLTELFIFKKLISIQAVGPSWYGSDWLYRVKITVFGSKVDADVVNFPVYVNLADLPAEFHVNVNQTDARDIRVTTANGLTEVPREVVFYNSTNDTGELHFKGDLLKDINVDFYIYYGNIAATDYAASDTFGRNNVWDAAAKMVQHFSENSGNHIDSTVNLNNGAPYGGIVQGTTGQIFGADSFDGVDDYIDMGNKTSLDMTSALTINIWLKRNRLNHRDYLISKGNFGKKKGYRFQIKEDSWVVPSKAQFDIGNGTNNTIILSKAKIFDNQWYHIVFTFDAGKANIYVNGIEGSYVSTGGDPMISEIAPMNKQFEIGGHYNDGVVNFDGLIDETRIYNKALSANEIKTQYNNQNSPNTFYIFGSAEKFFTPTSTPTLIPTPTPTPSITPTPSLTITPSLTPTPTITPTPAPKLSADLNSDGKVNSQDFAILMSAWNSTAKPKADINQDGLVDSLDFGLMMSFWG